MRLEPLYSITFSYRKNVGPLRDPPLYHLRER